MATSDKTPTTHHSLQAAVGLGFGSLVFSIWRGFGHLGAALFVGVGACFLTTVLILSGIIGLVERKSD